MSGHSSVDRPPGSTLALGDVVAEKYRIEREIGRGGMGIVFAAKHLTLDRLVAIKVMKADLLQEPRALNRLMFEAKSAAKIQSEHVAKVLDVGTLPEGIPYIVMEYLDGQDLGALIDRTGALSVQQSVTFVLQACEALAEVHVANLVHRDLKPGNLFIAKRADGSPSMKIVDFGISKYVGGPGAKVAKTTSPHVLGSPFYMAPEQMRADSVDARSDIWALGAILFEMLTARTPFTGETLPEVYAAVLGDPPPPVNELQPDVPSGLDAIVHRCLEKDPFLRFPDVAALARELAPFGDVTAQQSVERISRVLSKSGDGEAERLIGRVSAVPTSQDGTPMNLSGSSGSRDLSLTGSEAPPPRELHENGYPPDGTENELSLQAELASGAIGGSRAGSPERTVPIRRTHARNLWIIRGAAVVVFLCGALLLWPEEEPRALITPRQKSGTLLPHAEEAEVKRPTIPLRRAAQARPSVDTASGRVAPPVPPVATKGVPAAGKLAPTAPSKPLVASSAPETHSKRQVVVPRGSVRPERSRSQPAEKAPVREAVKTEPVAPSPAPVRPSPAVDSAEPPPSSPAAEPERAPRKGKKDYWDSDSFGARR